MPSLLLQFVHVLTIWCNVLVIINGNYFCAPFGERLSVKLLLPLSRAGAAADTLLSQTLAMLRAEILLNGVDWLVFLQSTFVDKIPVMISVKIYIFG